MPSPIVVPSGWAYDNKTSSFKHENGVIVDHLKFHALYPGKCEHTQWIYPPDFKCEWTGEWTQAEPYEEATYYEDWDTGRFMCTQCGLTLYYTGLWRDFYEKGIPCSGSDAIKKKRPYLKTIIAGSRTGATEDDILEAIAQCGWNITSGVFGGAPGVDTMAEEWAELADVPYHVYHADWVNFPKSGGFIRNKQMAEESGAQALIAVWDGESNGTRNMIFEAEKKGLRVYVHMIKGVKDE